MVLMLAMVVMVVMVVMATMVGFNIDRGDIKSIVHLMNIRRALVLLHSVKYKRHVCVDLNTVLSRGE